MNLETFFEKFDLFADIPNAIANMRKLVLDLAMHGKLVEQDPNEGDACTVLKAIGEAQKQYSRKTSSENLRIVESAKVEGWYDLPPSWQWVLLGTVGDIVGGGTPRSDNTAYFANDGIPWLTPADLNGFKEKIILRGRRYITNAGLENSSAQLLPAGSVLFSSRAPIGYVAIAGTELATNQGFKSCIPFIRETSEFLYYFLMSAASRIDREASGTTFREVSGKIVSQIPVPLPPIAEQQRIVAKVDELMALCDRLEAQQKERDARNAVLAHASLARFADAPTPENLNLLFYPSYTVSPVDLRKTILTLAVQGKLVPRTSAPKIGSLESVLAEASVNGVSKGPTPDTSATEILRISAGTSRYDFYVDEDDFKHVDLTPNEIDNFRLEPGDLLACRFNGNLRFVGRFSYYRGESGRIQVNPDKLIRFRINTAFHCPRYVCFAMNSAPIRNAIEGMCATTAGNIGLSAGKLKTVEIPLPSLEEQRRIVARVEQLMALVDQLEMQIATSRSTAEKLMEALVAELTAS